MILGVIATLAVLPGADAVEARPKVAVLPVQIDRSANEQVPTVLDDYVLTAVHKLARFVVIGQDDINAVLGFERQKDLVGCDDASCFAEVGGALGVDQIVSFKLARIGSDWAVTGKVIDIRNAVVLSRSSDFIGGDAKALLSALNGIVAKLLLPAGEAPAPVPSPAAPALAAPPSTAPREQDLVSSKDWQRYLVYRVNTRSPLALPEWAAVQNEESTALFVAELATPAVLMAAAVIGSHSVPDSPTDRSMAVIAVTAMFSIPVMLIVDLVDVGDVTIRWPR
ncbi:MAG: hypothetical protein HY903_17625 [Deltaproteobacteria bacterium]|nr:hypothetical protein [Deltaproteobacteria bacterium]